MQFFKQFGVYGMAAQLENNQGITLWDVIDMAVIAYVFYKLFILSRRPGPNSCKGILSLYLPPGPAAFRLYTVNWHAEHDDGGG